jgi:hypothetical protein
MVVFPCRGCRLGRACVLAHTRVHPGCRRATTCPKPADPRSYALRCVEGVQILEALMQDFAYFLLPHTILQPHPNPSLWTRRSSRPMGTVRFNRQETVRFYHQLSDVTWSSEDPLYFHTTSKPFPNAAASFIQYYYRKHAMKKALKPLFKQKRLPPQAFSLAIEYVA